ncbi:MAG: GGDEF domain-containing protein [Lachnospiraceae bacterium]|nr:GGDEF domain-containing protein [Lachnospiraceae bacterium]
MKKLRALFQKEDYLTPSVFIMRLTRQNGKMEHAILRYITGMELFMMFFGLFTFNLAKPRAILYISLYASLSLAAFLTDLAFMIGEKRNTAKRNRLIMASAYFFYIFIHIWALTVTTLDVTRGGTYWAAATALVATGVFIVLHPVFTLSFSIMATIYLGALHVYVNGWSASLVNILLFGMVLCIIDIRMYLGAYNTMYVEDRLRDQSYRDGLTAIRNRRALEEKLDQNSLAAGGCIALMDIDDFKGINDTEGHQSGDEALLLVASCLRDLFKDEEIYRYGGDEFVILSEHNTVETADRMKKVNDRLANAEREIDIRISCGIADNDPCRTAEETLGMADTVLYQVKQNGKGQVAVF